jgi:hypothetical protein
MHRLEKRRDAFPSPALSARGQFTGVEQGRLKNDLRLKSKFEAIFDKFERDFTDVGDEIDLETGRVVVDNGHLDYMQDERDPGVVDSEDEMSSASRTVSFILLMSPTWCFSEPRLRHRGRAHYDEMTAMG